MSETAIEWTQRTWNPLAGCKEISPGCTNCYAAVMAKRLEAMGQAKYAGLTRTLDNGKAVWTGKITLDEKALQEPLKRCKPTMYFVNSMSDLFHEDVPDEFVERVFSVMHGTPQHTYQVLTKRADRMQRFMTRPILEWTYSMMPVSPSWPFSNVWLGVSVEDQARADERIPLLLKTPAAVRFLSVEPLLGPVHLAAHMNSKRGFFANVPALECGGKTYPKRGDIDWVIVGGESGHGARPCNIAWIRSIVEQCKSAGVPVFVKQMGGRPHDDEVPVFLKDKKGGDIEEFPEDLRIRQFPEASQ